MRKIGDILAKMLTFQHNFVLATYLLDLVLLNLEKYF